MLRRTHRICALIGFFLIILTTPVLSQNRPVQIALFTPVQLFPENNSIVGIRLNVIYGCNTSVTGIDFGFVNRTTKGTSKGWQTGLVGINESDFVGWQDNYFINVTKANFEGLQLGIINYAGSAKGIQFGVINYAERMQGLQIGLLNIIKQDGAFPVFPIVNWSF